MAGTREAVDAGSARPGPPKQEELAYRLHQQSVLADFGRRALEASTLDTLLDAAVRLCADGMGARFCMAADALPDRDDLRVCADVGWRPGVVGRELLDMDSPAGVAFRTGAPVIANHPAGEGAKFRTPALLTEHGIKRTVVVPIPLGGGRRWGALVAHSPDESGRWDEADVDFMRGVARLLGVAIERRNVQRTLDENRAWLDVLLDTVDQIVWSARPDGFHDFFNRRWYEFCGAEPGTTDGDAWAQWLHPDDRERTFAAWRRSLETGEPYEIEYRFRNRAGDYRWILGRANPVRDASGRIIRWIGAGADIQAQKEFGERFRLLHRAHPSAYLVLSRDFTVEEASENWLIATMKRRDEMIGRNLFEAMPDNPDDPAATGVRNLRASLQRVLKTREADRMPVQRYDVRRPDQSFELRWWAPLNSPVLGPDGEVRHIIHQVEDVTAEMLERQKTADAQAGEARFRAVAETIPGLVFESDAEGVITYANRPFLDYTGELLQALGHDLQRVIHPDDRERVEAARREAVRTSGVFEVECRLRRTDGVWRWFMVRASPFRGGDGRVEKWIGVASDVDVAKQAEAVLREREEQFHTLADSLPQLAWMADANGWVYWYNRRWYEFTGTTLEQMQGWGWRAVHHPDHVDRVVARIQRSWDTGEPWEDLFPLRGADGRYRWFLSRASPLRNAEGRVVRWFGTNTDVTEQQEAAELQRTLLQEVSHRVKNSLALVSSLLTLQSRTLEGGPRTALEEAAARVHAIARVHDQLWRGVDARHVDLGPFLCDLSAAIAAGAPRHATVCRAEPAVADADLAGPLGLLVNELLTNAYKYAYPEGAEGEVRLLGAPLPDGRYRLEVADSGVGLPAGFDLAKSGDSLGMKVITALAAQLGGELTAGSADPGARFTLVFPLV